MKMIHVTCPGHPEATLEGYLLDCELSFGQEKTRPAIVVCPGGGYLYCSPREGEPVALRYAASGFHAFVLRYSTGRDAGGFAPLEEISWAIGYIREHAEAWSIAPERIVTCGFSAGGHLALAAGLMAENKPNAMILGYPATCAPNYPGVDFMLKLLEGREDVTDEDAEKYNLISKITKDSPPVFIAATAEDVLTSICTLPVAQAYSQLGKPYEMHIFQYGPHGLSLADVTTANGSSQVLDDSYGVWLELSVKWLLKTFGKPTFTDTTTSRMGNFLKELGFSAPDEGQAAHG